MATDFAGLWANAVPQGKGSYWKNSGEGRTLDFSEPVETILRRVRAFGELEAFAPIGNDIYSVRYATGWTEAHYHTPGTMVHNNMGKIVVAASDGYIVIPHWGIGGVTSSPPPKAPVG